MMRKKAKRTIWSVLVWLMLCLLLLSGCTSKVTEQTTGKTLWVVTEATVSDSMNYQAQQAVDTFEQEHPGVTVQLDILPMEADEREIRLKQLRAQIMAGKGPDVFLLPTSTTITTDIPLHSTSWKLIYTEVEPLFNDVSQPMHSGIFADVSSYYDADVALNTADLHPDVMDAGVVGDARYVLPLRYTMPVLLTSPEKNAEAGIDPQMINSGIGALVQHSLDTGNVMMGAGLRLANDLTMLPQAFDYEKGEMLISQQEIAQFMRLYQQWRATGGAAGDEFLAAKTIEVRSRLDEAWPDHPDDIFVFLNITFGWRDFNSYIANGRYFYHWSLEPLTVFTHDLPGVLEQAAIARVINADLEAHALRNMNGQSVAEVVYWGAVGSSCSDVGLAWDYLRLFLPEEYQHVGMRPRTDRSEDDIWNTSRERQINGMIENSWPVRVKGSATPLWETFQYQIHQEDSGIRGARQQMRKYNNRELIITDEEMPILFEPLDVVQFPIYQPEEESLAYALSQLNHEDGTPTDVDIDALAEKVYQYLWWHLAEG